MLKRGWGGGGVLLLRLDRLSNYHQHLIYRPENILSYNKVLVNYILNCVHRFRFFSSGEKCAFGHYYMRPHETFHEPSRRFFPCEVFRAPLYHVIPVDAIVGVCCVMDLSTYCKGRPKGVSERDVYICEYRVDKTAHLFSKITTRSKYQINTNPYCFDRFDVRLKPPRRTASVSVSHHFTYL